MSSSIFQGVQLAEGFEPPVPDRILTPGTERIPTPGTRRIRTHGTQKISNFCLLYFELTTSRQIISFQYRLRSILCFR